MKIIGYSVCGPHEKYMERTLDCFKRLCDETVILLNNGTPREEKIIKSYGFKVVRDNREWGKYQPRIKQDFVRNHLAGLGGHAYLTLDMDECFREDFTRAQLEELTKWHSTAFYFIQYWNDEQHHNPGLGFWSVRFWRHEPGLGYNFSNLHLHGGSVPQWALNACSYAPHIIKHYGLMDKADRMRKVERYKKYDPNNETIGDWYKHLSSETKGELFDEEVFQIKLNEEVAKYGPQIKTIMAEKKEKFYLVKNPHGVTIDIPERHLAETLKREGFKLLSQDPIMTVGTAVKSTEVEMAKEEISVPVEETNLVCPTCQFVSKTPFGLKSHQRKHR